MKRGTQEIKKNKKTRNSGPASEVCFYLPTTQKPAILDQQSTSFRQIRVSGSPHGQVAEPDIQETFQKWHLTRGFS